eukprot:TRINITY_DN10901_c0_g2_i1.p2 TRINITY_DN10901_c0_g2~~TRINITY_DN10901_c0_g2_i1.p2  ORF type:complete len:298 (+),score=105.57 TRINITY_DN10901_c0_g2_i1:112-1005(+)
MLPPRMSCALAVPARPRKAAPGSPRKPDASAPIPRFWSQPVQHTSRPPGAPSPGGSPPFSPVRQPHAGAQVAMVPQDAPVQPMRRGPPLNLQGPAVPQGSVPAVVLESHLKGRNPKSAKLDHGADHSSVKNLPSAGVLGRQRGQETNVTRLNSRQRQIDIGKNTIGYKMYCQMVPRDRRSRAHPKTPDKLQLCSKRSWDGQIRKWRRQIHLFDPDISEEDKKALQDLMIREALSGQTDDDDELEPVSDTDGSDWEDDEATSKSKQIALNALLRSVHRKALKLEQASHSAELVVAPQH